MDHGLGGPVPRVEDLALLTGQGRFGDDLRLAGAAHAVLLRSPHAHARLLAIDASAALRCPGVLGVFTAADLSADGVAPIPSLTRTAPFALSNADGSEMPDASRPVLVAEFARHVGDPVALLVAETRVQAEDAAEQVTVEWQPLPAVVDAGAAMAADAPRVWDEMPGNRSYQWQAGDAAAVDGAFAGAARVVRIEVDNPRMISVPLEPRAAAAEYDGASGRYTLHTGCQSVHQVRWLLSMALGVPEPRLRVLARDLGGGFGTRAPLYPEHVLLPWAAKRLGRPLHWNASRSECFLTDMHSRDQRLRGELALDGEGRFLAIRFHSRWSHGAYLNSRSLFVHVTSMAPMVCGAYLTPASLFTMEGVFTHTMSVHAFRGVARAEAAYLVERLVDAAARETGIDRVNLRRRNLVPAARMPWKSPTGATYADADFAANLEQALRAANWDGFAARRRRSSAVGLLRGIGLSLTVDSAGGVPREFAGIEVDADGRVTAMVGTRNFGLGHATVYAQVLAERLGVPFEHITLVDDDSDRVREGAGSHGSRSARMGGGALVRAADALIESGRELAAQLLQADAAALAFEGGVYRVAGTERMVPLSALAAHAAQIGKRLAAEAVFESALPGRPNGCQVCEVEVDPDTGAVRVLAQTVVHDVGRALNPMIVEGQIHGATVHGMAQALMDDVRYDTASGQLLSGSLMDYCLPRAGDLPPLQVHVAERPSADNPLGAKGAGEGPTVGATPAVVSAVLDALAPHGITHIDMPLTPERVWRALRAAGG